MSRPRPDRVDVLALSEHSLVDEDAQDWTLRYLLCRVRVGAAAAFVIRVHARPDAAGLEQCAVAGLDVPDARSAEALFHRLAEGCVFPVHLQDVVHDVVQTAFDLPEAAAMAPPAD